MMKGLGWGLQIRNWPSAAANLQSTIWNLKQVSWTLAACGRG